MTASSLTPETMMKLMAYADGELEGSERSEVETLLAKDEDAARFVEQVVGLGDFVKVGHDDVHAKAIASFDVADALMEKLAKVEGPKVVSLADARAKRSQTPITRTAVAGVVAVLALAASVFLLARPAETPMGPGTGQGKPMAAATDKPAPTEAPLGPGVEVNAVESPGQSVSVFYVPSGNELSTSVVVWVDETGEK